MVQLQNFKSPSFPAKPHFVVLVQRDRSLRKALRLRTLNFFYSIFGRISLRRMEKMEKE